MHRQEPAVTAVQFGLLRTKWAYWPAQVWIFRLKPRIFTQMVLTGVALASQSPHDESVLSWTQIVGA